MSARTNGDRTNLVILAEKLMVGCQVTVLDPASVIHKRFVPCSDPPIQKFPTMIKEQNLFRCFKGKWGITVFVALKVKKNLNALILKLGPVQTYII